MWGSLPRGREARGALIVSWLVLVYLVIQVIASMSWQVDSSVQGVRHGLGVVLSVVVALLFVRLQSDLVARRTPPVPGWRAWVLAVAGVALLPASDAWAISAVSFATMMLFFPARHAAVLVVTGIAVLVGTLAFHRQSPVEVVGIPMIVLLAAGVIAVLTRMVLVLEDLRLAREEIARLGIDEERTRISRELHDILGRTLVAASLRTQTALRLVDRDPEGARGQLESVAQTLSQGQTQLRVLVSGATIIDLDTEIGTAVDLFQRLGIVCEVSATPVPDGEGQLLAATVLREAVTNLLKHSRPRHVTITVAPTDGQVALAVVNDGAHGVRPSGHGTGLAELARSVADAGGRLESGPLAEGRFQVAATLPVEARDSAGARVQDAADGQEDGHGREHGRAHRRLPLADPHR